MSDSDDPSFDRSSYLCTAIYWIGEQSKILSWGKHVSPVISLSQHIRILDWICYYRFSISVYRRIIVVDRPTTAIVFHHSNPSKLKWYSWTFWLKYCDRLVSRKNIIIAYEGSFLCSTSRNFSADKCRNDTNFSSFEDKNILRIRWHWRNRCHHSIIIWCISFVPPLSVLALQQYRSFETFYLKIVFRWKCRLRKN